MNWLYLALILFILATVLFITGMIEWCKRGKKWNLFFKHYLGCIGRAFAGIFKALRGINPHRSVVATPSDAVFAVVTREQFDFCIKDARERMIREGIEFDPADKVEGQYGFYLHRCFDCGNMERTLQDYFDQSYRKNFGKAGFGIPTMPYPYDLDSGGGHVLFGCDVEGKLELYSPYPHKTEQVFPSETELQSYKPISKG